MYVKANGHLVHSQRISVPERSGAQLDWDVRLEPLAAGSSSTMRNLFFAVNSAALEEASRTELNQLVEFLTVNPGLRIEVSGHTDADGSAEHNQKLSEERANAVRDHLIGKGIPADRLVAKGHGASKPLAANDSDANKALNRRTDITVL